jgi:putative membrane protein
MFKHVSIITTGAAFVFAASLAAQPQDRQPTASQQPPAKSSMPAKRDTVSAAKQASPEAEEFLKNASQDNRAEIALGQLAATKAANAGVKSYARMLVTDHTKANQEVSSIARTKSVTLPTDLSAEQKSTKDSLTDLSGANFDRQFVDTMVKDHQKAVAAFEQQTTSSDAQVKAFAAKTLPTLRHHLEEAQRLQKTVGAGASSSSGK